MKIALIGTGYMGSWFASEFAKSHEVAVFDKDESKMHSIEGVSCLDNLPELKDFNPDILLNAVSLQNTRLVFKEACPHIREDCLIVDIATIKADIPYFYTKNPKFPFVSIHPMFGPHFANLHQLTDENVIIISESSEKGKQFFREFFVSFNLEIFEYSFKEHDELMAYSLTLPFASSIVFSACVTTNTVPGTTFSRHRQIAQKLLKEDNFLLSEVLFNPNSLPQLEKICSRLEFLKHVIKARDYEESEKFFNKLRKNLTENANTKGEKKIEDKKCFSS